MIGDCLDMQLPRSASYNRVRPRRQVLKDGIEPSKGSTFVLTISFTVVSTSSSPRRSGKPSRRCSTIKNSETLVDPCKTSKIVSLSYHEYDQVQSGLQQALMEDDLHAAKKFAFICSASISYNIRCQIDCLPLTGHPKVQLVYARRRQRL
jgi:hypothetical protein